MDEEAVILHLIFYLGLQINSFFLENLVSDEEFLRNNQQILAKVICGATIGVCFDFSDLLLGSFGYDIIKTVIVLLGDSPSSAINIDGLGALIVFINFQDYLADVRQLAFFRSL